MKEGGQGEKQFVEESFAQTKQLLREFSDAKNDAQDTRASEEERKEARKNAVRLQAIVEAKTDAIYEHVSPFERPLGLREQYERQKSNLFEAGILKEFGRGEFGIVTITGEKALFPTYREVSKRLSAIDRTKIKQGLTQLRITPFGMSLLALADIYKNALITAFNEGRLHYPKRNPDDADEPLEKIPESEFNKADPLYINDEFKGQNGTGADIEGTIVYGQTLFDKDNHGGKTKAQILADDPSKAFLVSLAEVPTNIPREGHAKITGTGRTQIDTKGTQIKAYMKADANEPCPSEYLAAFQGENQDNTVYTGERGQTPEEQLTEAIEEAMKEQAFVMHDYQGAGSINYLIGAYFLKLGRVPSFLWVRGGRQANLNWGFPDFRGGNYGVRPVAGEPISL